jgi:hypothetical protein
MVAYSGAVAATPGFNRWYCAVGSQPRPPGANIGGVTGGESSATKVLLLIIGAGDHEAAWYVDMYSDQSSIAKRFVNPPKSVDKRTVDGF